MANGSGTLGGFVELVQCPRGHWILCDLESAGPYRCAVPGCSWLLERVSGVGHAQQLSDERESQASQGFPQEAPEP